jgi:4-hydroxy-2-oxoglutarate aldolase
MTNAQIIDQLNGIFPPLVTPFNRRGEVDFGHFRENVKSYAGTGVSGIVIAGSTGEAPYLTDQERVKLVEAARDLVRPPQVLIVGTGLESTLLTLKLSRKAIACGADALLVITPNYFKARMAEAATQIGYYRAVADGVRRPVIIYNIPQFTGIRMAPKTIASLSGHPNIVGLKESSGDLKYDREILRAVRRGFRFFTGSPPLFLDVLRSGAAGGVLGQANYAPEVCVGIYQAFQNRQFKLASDLQRRLTYLAANIAVPFGVPGVKVAVELRGLHGGPPRAPLAPLPGSKRKVIAAMIREATQGLAV